VQRYLHDEPVQACPPTVGYRLRKLVRRNRGPMLAVGLVLLALVAGIIGTTWGLVRADKARRDAVAAQLAEANRAAGERRAKDEAQRTLAAEREAREAESAQRRRAEDNTKLAMAALDEIMDEGRQRLTLSMQDGSKGLAKDPERDKLERAFLEKGLRFYEQLAQTNATDWAARRARAQAYANVGLLHVDLENYAESEKAYREAIRLMEGLAEERPEDFENTHGLAETYLSLAWSYWMTRRLQPMEEITRHALALFEKLTADFPARRPQVEADMGRCQQRLGDMLQGTGKFQEAEKAFRAAITCWEHRIAESPEVADYWVYLSWNYDGLGQVLQATGQVNEAEKAYRQALAIWKKLGTDGPERRDALRDAARLRGLLAGLLAAAKRTKEAEEAYRQAQANWEKLAAAVPSEPGYQSNLAYLDWSLGNLLRDTGQAQEAEKAYSQAVAIGETMAAKYPGNAGYTAPLSTYVGALAENLLHQGKHAEAAKLAGKIPDAMPKDANGYQSAALVLARCMALADKDAKLPEADRKAVAQAYADRARELLQEAARRGPDTPGARELREALRLPPDDPQAHYKLGVALHSQGWFAEAEAEFREPLRLRPDFPEARAKLGFALWKQGKNAEAEAECREALRLRPGDSEATFTLGLVLYWGGEKPAAAARFYAEAFAAHPKLANDLRFTNRYNAACHAARAGCGQGQDAAGLGEAERARLRRQALDWLRADLAAWGQFLEKEPDQARPRVQQALRMWQQDADFAGVRGDALAKLPEAERQTWQQLWEDVEQTLRKVDHPDTKDTQKKSPRNDFFASLVAQQQDGR
jgi:tetratricopeptide (TPR) repeat protein